jgi:hypothetical protein
MSTYKTEVFELLFDERWDANDRVCGSPTVTLRQISEAIGEYNRRHHTDISRDNPANFFKDFVRNISLANTNWPPSVLERGYTAASLKGENGAFRFVPATDPLRAFARIDFPENREPVLVQSLSIPPLARKLGRRDETWLMQVSDRLNLIQTHLARSEESHDICYIELLQLGIKQLKTEIDGLYLAQTFSGRAKLITVEAKVRDDIYLNQIVDQVEAVQQMRKIHSDVDSIIPIAIKVDSRSIIRVVQFTEVPLSGPAGDLAVEWQQRYKLWPEVAGI